MGGEWRCVSPVESVQSQWIMSDVAASSPAVFYEVMWSLTSMGSLLPQKLNRDWRIWFHGVLWSTTVRANQRNQNVISLAGLLVYLFTMIFAATLVNCIASLVYIFVSTLCRQFFFTYSVKAMKWGSRQVCSSPASLWVTLVGSAVAHELLRVQPTCCLPIQFG